jgi:hypothetical protein
MELLADVGHVESHFGPSGDSVSVGARWVHGLRQTSHLLKNHFGHTRWSDGLKWKLGSVHLEIVVILMQDRCTVCIERTRGSKIVMDTPDGTTM